MTLPKLHALSAVLIAAFACLHIVNHLVGLSGAAQHIVRAAKNMDLKLGDFHRASSACVRHVQHSPSTD